MTKKHKYITEKDQTNEELVKAYQESVYAMEIGWGPMGLCRRNLPPIVKELWSRGLVLNCHSYPKKVLKREDASERQLTEAKKYLENKIL